MGGYRLWKAPVYPGASRRWHTCPGLDACQESFDETLCFYFWLHLVSIKAWSEGCGRVINEQREKEDITKHWKMPPTQNQSAETGQVRCGFHACVCVVFVHACVWFSCMHRCGFCACMGVVLFVCFRHLRKSLSNHYLTTNLTEQRFQWPHGTKNIIFTKIV